MSCIVNLFVGFMIIVMSLFTAIVVQENITNGEAALPASIFVFGIAAALGYVTWAYARWSRSRGFQTTFQIIIINFSVCSTIFLITAALIQPADKTFSTFILPTGLILALGYSGYRLVRALRG